MAFVVSEGKLTTLDRPMPVAAARVSLAYDYTADYAELWRTQPQVRTVVGFLARNIAQLGLHTFRRSSDTNRTRLTDDPLARLIAKPNARTTRYRLIDALVNDLGIYDVACWLKMQPSDATAGLVRLPPAKIEPVGDTWAWPDGIRFRGSRGETTFTMDQVVLFRGYNPLDARWGVSPMETLRRILAEEYQAGQYREQLWRNGARFPGHIRRPATSPKWSDPARERFRADWRGLYTGNGPGAGGTPILEDGMEFHQGGITPEQAQYLEARKLTREEVAAAFHIPLPMVGILDHATFSNIEEQHKQLYQDTLGPWLTMIQEEIGLQLVPEFDQSGAVYVEFNLAEKLKGSFEDQAKNLQTAVGGPWLTRNEARARQNLPQIDGGDDLIVPLNVVAGGQASPTDSGTQNQNARAEQVQAIIDRFLSRQSAAAASRKNAGRPDWWQAERWTTELVKDLQPVIGRPAAEEMAAAVNTAAYQRLSATPEEGAC